MKKSILDKFDTETVFLKYALFFFLHPSTQSHLYYKYVQKIQKYWIFHIILQASVSLTDITVLATQHWQHGHQHNKNIQYA